MKKTLGLIVLVAVGVLGTPQLAHADMTRATKYDQTCGLLPGDGAYAYIRVKNISCGNGKRVAFKSRKKFCASRNECRIDPYGDITQVYRGKVRRNGWTCKVATGWEYLRIKCRKGKMFLIWRSAA